MISLKNVYKEYKIGNKKYSALKNINLELRNKGFVSILGPSGCGKTTLLNLIGGLDKTTTGDIYVNGVNSDKFKSSDWDSYRNNTIGFIFQSFNLLNNLSIYNNVELAVRLGNQKKQNRKKSVYEALKKVGIDRLANKKPSQLSGGEQQRVAIARAIVNKPQIILADEPTGSLDSINSIEIMNILKELSKEHLVVLVTHNEELANTYCDRLVKMKDGSIEKDIVINSINNDMSAIKLSKVHMPLITSAGLALKNIINKAIRTSATILTGCIGIVAVCLVLTVFNGVSKYINSIQTNALNDYPIIIRSNNVISNSGNIYNSREEYPNTNKIMVTKSITNYEQISNLDKDFVSYIKEMDSTKYSVLNYNRKISMRLFAKVNDDYLYVSTSRFTEMVNDEKLINNQYDILYGKIPTEYNELVLVIDKYNCITSDCLESLRITNTEEFYTYEDFIGLKYRLVENNIYYKYDESLGIYRSMSGSINYPTLYESSNVELTIVGIIREKPENVFGLYKEGLLYNTKLTDYILNSANESEIVKTQKQYGYDKDVTTGVAYKEQQTSSTKYSIEYQYDNDMIAYGAEALITNINIYSLSFEDRLFIEEYVKNYEQYKNLTNITYSDYMSTLTKDLTSFIDILSKVLLVLALVSVVIAFIMIAIITYISVVERTKEIGILRALGTRRIDIVIMFLVETMIIGFFGGVLGVLLAQVLKNPLNMFTQNVIKESISFASSVTRVNLIDFDYKIIVLLVMGNVTLTVLSGMIPAIIASMKNPIKALKTE